MYHLKPDIRAKRSAELLYEGLISKLKEKELTKVTISDICKASTVSRATFYRHFDDVIDVLSWKFDQLFNDLIREFIASKPDLHKENSFLLFAMKFWMMPEHEVLIETLLSAGRSDIIAEGLTHNTFLLVQYLAGQGLALSLRELTYFMHTRAGYFTGMMIAWIQNGKKESPEELTAIVQKQYHMVVSAGMLF
jgi:AcrR family transcriptional regulator